MKHQAQATRPMTVEEAAEYLQVEVQTMRKWLRAGKIPGAYKMGRLWRIPPEGLTK